MLDFLSGGRLSGGLQRLHRCLGRASCNHDKVWLPGHPDLMPFLRRGKTEAEVHDALSKNINDAKGVLLNSIYQM